MRRSIIYNGHDFGEYTTAEVYECATSPIRAYALPVANAPVTDMLSGRPSPKTVRVRLFMDVHRREATGGAGPHAAEGAAVRIQHLIQNAPGIDVHHVHV